MTLEPSHVARCPDLPLRPCPNGACLIVRGEHYPCTTMSDMHPDSPDHDGWAHSNGEAGAVWQ